MSFPLSEHLSAANHVLRYLSATKDLGLKYIKNKSNNTLTGYADASFGSIPDSGRSITGYVFMLNNAAISWKTQVQPTVALSTSESEYMALCASVQEAMFLRGILEDMSIKQETTVIFEDNQPCIRIAENRITSQRSKHINVKYHFIRQAIYDGYIRLEYIPTNHQRADILTKILAKPQNTALRNLILGSSKLLGRGEV